MDQLPQLVAALVPILAAIGGLELRHRGRAKDLVEDRRLAELRSDEYSLRLATAEAAAFRRLSLLRRTLRHIIDAGEYDSAEVTLTVTTLIAAIERETSQ